MHLLDGRVILAPADVGSCEFSLLQQVQELRGLHPPTPDVRFLGERHDLLLEANRQRVVKDYQRRYNRMFTDSPEDTVAALRSLQVVTGGEVQVELNDAVALVASPTVMMAGQVADTVLERFARAEDLLALGAQAFAVEVATGRPVTSARLHFNNDRSTEYDAEELSAVARLRLEHLAALIESPPVTLWGSVVACGFCARCKAAADAAHDVHLVWGVRRNSRRALVQGGISTIEELAKSSALETIDRGSWSRFHTRAQLQLNYERTGTLGSVVHNPAGLAALPPASPGDIFFDFEGDPLWVEKNRYEWGLEFLFGYIEADTGQYTALWSTSQREEKRAFTTFLEYLRNRLKTYPDMHVYHYAFYEPASMRRLARRHRVGQKEVGEMLNSGLFVDLYDVVKNSIHTSGRSYGLKALEAFYMDDRGAGVTDGAAAVVAFSEGVQAKRKGDTAAWEQVRTELAAYNEADCASTWKLRDWLLPETDPVGGEQAAMDLLGATPLDSELLLTPLEEEWEDLSDLQLRVPGFDETGIFYVSSGNSTDALGAEHKVHEFLGRWASGSVFAPGREVLVVYAHPDHSPTDASGLVARRATLEETDVAGAAHRVVAREATPAYDPATTGLTPIYLDTHLPPPPAKQVLKQAKRITYTLLTGPRGAVHEVPPDATVINDAHNVSLQRAVELGADHLVVVGDPACAEPTPRRASAEDVVAASVLNWLLGESGAKVTHKHTPASAQFFPELGQALKEFAYPDADFPPATGVRLAPPEFTGVVSSPVTHEGNTDASTEEVEAVQALVKRLFSASPLAESDVIVTAIYDTQVMLLKQALSAWPGVQVLPAREAHETAAISIVSLATSSWAEFAPPPAHLLTSALTSGQESAIVVHSSELFSAPPPRAQMFTDVARLINLLGR